MIFLRKKCSFSRYRPLRSVLFGVLPPHSDQRKAGTPALRLLRMFHLYNSFFLPDFFASVRRFPPVVLQTDAPPAVTPESRRPLSPIYNRCKTVRRLPALPSPPSVSSDRRRIPEQTAPRDAGNAVSRTKTNFETLEMPYI